jgi:hypothetical protein
VAHCRTAKKEEPPDSRGDLQLAKKVWKSLGARFSRTKPVGLLAMFAPKGDIASQVSGMGHIADIDPSSFYVRFLSEGEISGSESLRRKLTADLHFARRKTP